MVREASHAQWSKARGPLVSRARTRTRATSRPSAQCCSVFFFLRVCGHGHVCRLDCGVIVVAVISITCVI